MTDDPAPLAPPPWVPPAAWAPPPVPAPPARPMPPVPPVPAWPPGPPPRRYPPLPPREGRRPPLAVFLVLLALFLVHAVWRWARHGPVGDVDAQLGLQVWWLELAAAGVVVLVVLVGRWAPSTGWVPRRALSRPVPVLGLVLAAFGVALVVASGTHQAWGPARYAALLVNCLAVGVFEETMFRGLLWASLPARWSMSRVLLVTSVAFGGLHLVNGLATGRWDTAAAQAVVVTFTGMGLGALRLRSGWIGLAVLTHALVDAGLVAASAALPQDFGPTDDPATLPWAVLGLILPFFVLYVSLAVSGLVVLVRTFRAERQERRLAAWRATRPPAPVGLAPPTLGA